MERDTKEGPNKCQGKQIPSLWVWDLFWSFFNKEWGIWRTGNCKFWKWNSGGNRRRKKNGFCLLMETSPFLGLCRVEMVITAEIKRRGERNVNRPCISRKLQELPYFFVLLFIYLVTVNIKLWGFVVCSFCVGLHACPSKQANTVTHLFFFFL